MQLGFINQNEIYYKNTRKKQARKVFSFAIAFSSLMLLFLMAESFIDIDVYRSIFYTIADALAYIVSGVSDMTYTDARNSALSMMNTEVFSTCFNMFVYLVTIIIPFLILAKFSGIKLKQACQVNTDCPKKFWLYIPFTIGAGYAVNLVVRLIFGDLLNRFTETEAQVPHTTAGIILYFVMISVLPAVFEEWAFRGVLLRSLLPFGKMFALTVSSVTFGMMHVNPPQAVFATCFGFLAGFIYIKTGSIWYGALIHLLNNAFSTLMGFSVAYKGLESPSSTILSMVVIAVLVCFVVALVIFIRKGFFNTGVMHSITPPDKSKLSVKQYFSLSLANVFTVLFILIYITTLIIRYFPETLNING
jgi:membrane protease YdiL (CAAX protease family)